MANFNLDPVHSGVNFSIQHLVISNVKGRFNDFDADITGDFHDLSSLKGTFTVQANSIDTKVEDRDNHILKLNLKLLVLMTIQLLVM